MKFSKMLVVALHSNWRYALSLFVVCVTTEFGDSVGHGTYRTPSVSSKLPTTRPVTFTPAPAMRAWIRNPLNKRGPNTVSFRVLRDIETRSPARITFDSRIMSTGITSGVGFGYVLGLNPRKLLLVLHLKKIKHFLDKSKK